MQDAAGLRQAMEYYDGQGWTDGLPVVPVTESYLASFLAQAGRDPDDVLLDMPHLNRALTVRLAAINAALAGLPARVLPGGAGRVGVARRRGVRRPGHLAVHHRDRAVPDRERAGARAARAEQHGERVRLGLPGQRDDRPAIRLGAINAFGLRPHELDQATQGTPAKYTACIAENEEQSPWPALHTEAGLDTADSAVTAMVIRSCVHIEARHTKVPEQLATDLAGTIARTGALIHETISAALVLSPEHARLLGAAGWSKADVRQAVYEHAVLSWPELVAAGKEAVSSRTRWRLPADHPDALPVSGSGSLHVLTSPEAVLVVVAGAGNAGVSAVVETFGPRGGPPPVVRVP